MADVWAACKVGNGVLLECAQRWYIGVVKDRNAFTVTLENAVCGHDLGDYGLFLEGVVSVEAELLPLPREIEINLATSVDSAQEYPIEYLERIRYRTHDPLNVSPKFLENNPGYKAGNGKGTGEGGK